MMKPALLTLAIACVITPVIGAELSKAQLVQLAVDQKTCGAAQPKDAFYDPPGGKTVKVICDDSAAGFIPAVGVLGGVGVGAAAGAAASLALGASAGGAGSTPSTN